MTPRRIALTLAAVAALGLSACGSDTEEALNDLQESGEQIVEKADDLTGRQADIQKRLDAGEITAAEAQKELEELSQSAKDLGSEALDASEKALEGVDVPPGTGGAVDEAEKALEDAQKELETTTP